MLEDYRKRSVTAAKAQAEIEKNKVVIAAEAQRDKAILEAEAQKQKAILAAEADKEKQRLEGEGLKARKLAEAEGVKALKLAEAAGEEALKLAMYGGEAGLRRQQVEFAEKIGVAWKGLMDGKTILTEKAFMQLGEISGISKAVQPVVDVAAQ